MNFVGIDVFNGKSMIVVICPLGKLVIPPFEVGYTDVDLCELLRILGELDDGYNGSLFVALSPYFNHQKEFIDYM